MPRPRNQCLHPALSFANAQASSCVDHAAMPASELLLGGIGGSDVRCQLLYSASEISLLLVQLLQHTLLELVTLFPETYMAIVTVIHTTCTYTHTNAGGVYSLLCPPLSLRIALLEPQVAPLATRCLPEGQRSLQPAG